MSGRPASRTLGPGALAGSGARCMQVWSSAPAGISSFQRVSVVAAACRCKKKAGNFHHRIMRVNSQTKVKVIRSKKKGNKFWRKKWKLKGSKIHHRRTAWTESEYDGVAVACVVADHPTLATRIMTENPCRASPPAVEPTTDAGPRRVERERE